MMIVMLWDASVIFRGDSKQITEALFKRCKHKFTTIEEYMIFRQKIELNYSGYNVSVETYNTFIKSLVDCGFLIQLN